MHEGLLADHALYANVVARPRTECAGGQRGGAAPGQRLFIRVGVPSFAVACLVKQRLGVMVGVANGCVVNFPQQCDQGCLKGPVANVVASRPAMTPMPVTPLQSAIPVLEVQTKVLPLLSATKVKGF